VRVQILGVRLVDPEGQPFGVLGFQLPPSPPTPVARTTPTPCGVGQCFDTLSFRCTGHTCGPDSHCPLPNQLCDVSGRFCPCEPPPPRAHRQVCCQCKEPQPACFDFPSVEVQPICPLGCEVFLGQDCDAGSGRCAPLASCSSDKECDDGNGCTLDRCTSDGCTHDCVCVGPHACGSAHGMPRPY
jgi:hypothetical protein